MSGYYTLADIERIGPEGCLRHMNELHEANKNLTDAAEHLDFIQQLARDLLARLSQDYGDSEYNDDHEIYSLFERGDRWLPVDYTRALLPPVMAICANCYHTTLCADDGEAFICVNVAQCRTNRANPVFTCEECGRETHVRTNGSCVECAEKETRKRHAV